MAIAKFLKTSEDYLNQLGLEEHQARLQEDALTIQQEMHKRSKDYESQRDTEET